jgi:hypothetical protein
MRNKLQGIIFAVWMVRFSDGDATATVGFEDVCDKAGVGRYLLHCIAHRSVQSNGGRST